MLWDEVTRRWPALAAEIAATVGPADSTTRSRGQEPFYGRQIDIHEAAGYRARTKALALLFALITWGPAAFAQTPQHAPPSGLACPGDRPVWVNTRSSVYNFQGER
jgi:hypothetical protein